MGRASSPQEGRLGETPGIPARIGRAARLSVKIEHCQVLSAIFRCWTSGGLPCWTRHLAGKRTAGRSGAGRQIHEGKWTTAPIPFLNMKCNTLSRFAAASVPATDGIDGDGSGSIEDQGEGHGAERESELVSTCAQQAMLPVHLPNRHAHVQEDEECCQTREGARDQQDS